MPVFEYVKKEDLEKLKEFGFYSVPVTSEHELVRLQTKTTTLVLFKSHKLLIQGKPDIVQREVELLKQLNIGQEVKPPKFKEERGIIIGSDEALKGDTFGGIVVAAVKANDDQRTQLLNLNVADSKTLSDEEILVLAPKVEKVAEFEIKNLYPEEYNEFKGSVTQMLNRLHKECYYYLKPGKHVVDKFPGCTVGDIAETKAESKYVEVAAASILARAHALKQLSDLSERAGFPIPKGSTHVEAALKELSKRHLHPQNFVKLNFRNVKKVLEL